MVHSTLVLVIPNTIPANMKVKKIRSNLIKPHTPTPQHLKNYRISFVDQFIRPINIAVILFYESKPEGYIRQLQESLAKTLVQFYILAGRYIKNDHIVDCSDQGADFIEAEALEMELLDFVAKNNAEQLDSLFPPHYFRGDEEAHDPLLSIQATHFSCGGAAIAVSVSHRIFDASSLGTFVAFWSNSCNPDQNIVDFAPTFNIPSLLPYWDLDLGLGSGSGSDGSSKEDAEKVHVKRLLFDREAIKSLRSETERTTVSAVRIVCAVIAGALIRTDRVKHGKHRDLAAFQLINMRGRTVPPQPKHVCGNFVVPSHVLRITASRIGEAGMKELVAAIGDGVRSSVTEYAEILSPQKDGRGIIMNTLGNVTREISTPETNVLAFTDWSKCGFYGADFGWGKPVWTGTGPMRPDFGTVILVDDKEGNGVEAWVHLKEDDMRYFEEDEEIRSKYLQPKIQG